MHSMTESVTEYAFSLGCESLFLVTFQAFATNGSEGSPQWSLVLALGWGGVCF